MQPLPDDERLIPPETRPVPWSERLPQWGGGLLLLAIMVVALGVIERTGVGLWFTGVLTGLVVFASLAVWALLMLLGLSSRVRLVGARHHLCGRPSRVGGGRFRRLPHPSVTLAVPAPTFLRRAGEPTIRPTASAPAGRR